jgi:hypothetical protein
LIAGTNPLNGHGTDGILRGKLSASTTVPGNFDLAWSQLTGKSYQPQQSSDLTLASWLPMRVAVTASTFGSSVFSFAPVGTRSFYRLGVSDEDPDGGNPQPIPPAPDGEHKVRLSVSTFLGETYPSTQFLTPFSVKILKNTTTGVEPLAHVLTYTGSTAILPNDGSVYTIQAVPVSSTR